MASPAPHRRCRTGLEAPACVRTLCSALRGAGLVALVLGPCVAQCADEEAFYVRYKRWTQTLNDPDPRRMAAFIHFPLRVDGHSFTEVQFGNDPAVARGLFSAGVRERLRAIPLGEIQSFEDRAGFDAAEGGCPDLAAAGAVFEVDVEADHGGPARRFIFGGEAVGYRLFCVTRP